MSLQDPISNMLTQIRNAQMARKSEVSVPQSKSNLSIIRVLHEEGYIAGFEEGTGEKPRVLVHLKYFKQKPVIEMVRRVSRPGLRVYAKKDALPKVKGGLGIAVISTSKGVMTDKQAAQLGQGGEVLCIVA